MLPTPAGALRLFRVLGITVYLHYSWVLVLIIFWPGRDEVTGFHNNLWVIAQVVALFAIVLLHEFGHALACRSVGGRADQIVLWPLGGVAYVQPPMRPGAVLWSIAAGPLVNVILVPITVLAAIAANLPQSPLGHDARWLFTLVAITNGALLFFNLLPVYPLDGGQIVQALLWYLIGYARSLMVVAVMGIIVAGLGGVAALLFQDYWLVVMALFIGWRAWYGFRLARMIAAAQRQHSLELQRQAAIYGPSIPTYIPPAER